MGILLESMDKETADYMVPALQRGLSILSMFDANVRSLSINDIARQLGITPSSCYRILFTLTEMGYLNKSGPTTSWVPVLSAQASAIWPAAT